MRVIHHQAIDDLIGHCRTHHRCEDWQLSNRSGASWCTMCELLRRVDCIVMPGAGESGGTSAQVGDRDTREPQSAGASEKKMGRPRGALNADGPTICTAIGNVLSGMSPKAAAIEAGVPESTVRTWLRRNGVRRVYRRP